MSDQPGARPTIAAVGRLSPLLIERLTGFTVLRADADLAWTGALDVGAGGVRALVAGAAQNLPTEWLARFPALEAIALHGAGTDGIDLAALDRRGVAVATTPDVLSGDVADLAVALLLAVARRLVANDRLVRERRWGTSAAPPLGRRMAALRVGLIGIGRIGRAIASRLDAFGCAIAYTARHRVADLAYSFHPSARDLAAAVDALIVTVPGGRGTDGMIDMAVLRALGPAGFLVNVARGSVVDEQALHAALADGAIGGAGLDVYANEPVSAAAFAGFDTVVLQPHQGSATLEARTAMAELVVANLNSWFATGRLLTPATAPTPRA